MSSPKLTFILFAYNQERYIRQAISSAFAQNYSPLEIILSDDGSQDRTYEIMQKMTAAYCGLHTIVLNRNEPNLGVGLHVNKAFGLANGDWIVTGAGDDVSDPDRCLRVAELASLHPDAGAIGHGWRDMDEHGCTRDADLLERYTRGRVDTAYHPDWIEHFQSGDFGLWGMSAAWKRDLIKSCPSLDADVVQEDEILTFWAALIGLSVVHDSHPLVSYRHHEANACGYNANADIDLQEKRKTRRADMAATTWAFLIKHLDQASTSGVLSWDESVVKTLRLLLKAKERSARLDSDWWGLGTMTRLSSKLSSPGRGGFLNSPHEWLRILPYPLYRRLQNRPKTKNLNHT